MSNDATSDLSTLVNAATAPVRDAASAAAHARQILIRDREVGTAYPTASLGPLSAACRAISEAGQVQPAMAGQCLLGAAALLSQGLYNVETLTDRKPLSLYLLTLGDSGDGKSTAQGVAMSRVNDWQRRQSKAYAEALAAIETAKGKSRKGGAGMEPMPSCPYRLVGDATVEGLRRDLDGGVFSQGVFTDEAAAILSGHGMSPDHRSKTAGVFSKLWDDGHLSVSRATGGRVERYGRRLSLHWLVQPTAAAEAVSDALLSSLGFWPRFLLAWPSPQSPRSARTFRAADEPDIRDFWSRCDELLAEPLGDDGNDLPLISLSTDARSLIGKAFEAFEIEGRKGIYSGIKPFALRATEQTCRVAGVLSAFAGERSISSDAAADALHLVNYSIGNWLSVIDDSATDDRAQKALRLYLWLLNQPNWSARTSFILNSGPACARRVTLRDPLISMLEDASLVDHHDGFLMAREVRAPSGMGQSR